MTLTVPSIGLTGNPIVARIEGSVGSTAELDVNGNLYTYKLLHSPFYVNIAPMMVHSYIPTKNVNWGSTEIGRVINSSLNQTRLTGQSGMYTTICLHGRRNERNVCDILTNKSEVTDNPFLTARTRGTTIAFYEEEVFDLCSTANAVYTFRHYNNYNELIPPYDSMNSIQGFQYINTRYIYNLGAEHFLIEVAYRHYTEYSKIVNIVVEKAPLSRQKYIATFLNSWGAYEKLLLYGEGSISAAWERGDEQDIQKYDPPTGLYLMNAQRATMSQNMTLRAGYSSAERQAFIADMVGSPDITITMPDGTEVPVLCTTTELPLYNDSKDYMEAELEFKVIL